MKQEQTIICRCEEVTLETLLSTLQTYPCSPRELKLRTRAGMGACGGRTCRPLMEEISRLAGGKNTYAFSLTYQPPVRPVRFGLLGELNDGLVNSPHPLAKGTQVITPIPLDERVGGREE